jgi:hypothetical protein
VSIYKLLTEAQLVPLQLAVICQDTGTNPGEPDPDTSMTTGEKSVRKGTPVLLTFGAATNNIRNFNQQKGCPGSYPRLVWVTSHSNLQSRKRSVESGLNPNGY